jgi:hypothetical protein
MIKNDESLWSRYREWILFGVLLIVPFGLGLWGFTEYLRNRPEQGNFWNVLYLTLQLFVAESGAVEGQAPLALNIARFAAPLAPIWAVIKTLTVILGGTLRAIRLKRLKHHVVICGVGRRGHQLAVECLERDERVIMIDARKENDLTAGAEELGAHMIRGNAEDPTLLRKARVHQARWVFMTTNSSEMNLDIAIQARRLAVEGRPAGTAPLSCYIHIDDTQLLELLRDVLQARNHPVAASFHFFSVWENAARLLLEQHPLDYAPVTRENGGPVRLVIIGFEAMGQSVALQAARIGHFANGQKLRVTIVDNENDPHQKDFIGRYPAFPELCDTEFVTGDPADPEIITKVAERVLDRNELTSVVVAIPNDLDGLKIALSLLKFRKEGGLPHLVHMNSRSGVASLFTAVDGTDEGVADLHPFGGFDSVCGLEMVVHERLDRLAQAVHEFYSLGQIKQGRRDESTVAWAVLPPEYRESSRANADHIPIKLRVIGARLAPRDTVAEPITEFTGEQIKILAEMEHARWVAERRLSGWTSGPKDVRKRTNPNLVPWCDLGEKTKEIDRNTVRDIPRILARAGEAIQKV